MRLLPHACLQARKRAPGAMLFVQFTLQRSDPNWPFFRGAMMEQSDWCMHNSVPDDTPPAPPASMPQPLWGSTYFLTPAAAEALWPFLTLGERASLQAAEWWVHADLRWYIRGMAALPDLLCDSSSSASEQEALRTRRPRRAG